MSSRRFARGSAAGNLITLLLLVGVVALGAWLWLGKKKDEAPSAGSSQTSGATQPAKDNGIAKPDGDAPSPIEPVIGTPTLEAAQTYVPKDNTLRIDISEYAGYGGLIVANGGLMPVRASALQAAGTEYDVHQNSIQLAEPRLGPFIDRWAAPDWLPLANVFSVGDVVIALGAFVIVLSGMGVQRSTLPRLSRPSL